MSVPALVVYLLSHVQLFCDPMDYSPPGSSVHGFSRQKYWSGLPFPSPGDHPNLGIEPESLALAGGIFTLSYLGSPRVDNKEKFGSMVRTRSSLRFSCIMADFVY